MWLTRIQVIHKLSIQTPENYLVFQYLNEIAKYYSLDWHADFAPEPVRIETGLPAAPQMMQMVTFIAVFL
jgi:hypothetical protein